MNRAIWISASMALGLSAAFAQQPATTAQSAPKLPACSQSLITGTTWQVLFLTLNGWPPFFCPISISSNGTITPGNCTISAQQNQGVIPLQQLPSGTLTIDRMCRVTGSITYILCVAVIPTTKKPFKYRFRSGVLAMELG